MAKRIRVIGVKRKEIDEEKLALAFLLLARSMHKNASVKNGNDRPEASLNERTK